MKIQLESWQVSELAFNILGKELDPRENSFSLRTSQNYPENDKYRFLINFDVTINDKEFDLHLKMGFVFKTEEEIAEPFKVSDFPKINAPAIAFPFIRAYVSNFTLQSGFKPVILPSINFVQLAQEE